MITFFLGALALASGVAVVLSAALHISFWSGAFDLPGTRDVLATGFVPVMISTLALTHFHTQAEGSRWTFESLLRGTPRWAMPTLAIVWAYAVWTSVVGAYGLFGISDDDSVLLASSAFFGTYSTIFAINFAAFQRGIGRWSGT